MRLQGRPAIPRTSVHLRARRFALSTLFIGALLAGCSGSKGGGGGQSGVIGHEQTKPGSTDVFLVDPNRSGNSGRLVIEELRWGRIVAVYDFDPVAETRQTLVFEDFAIGENVQTNVVFDSTTGKITGGDYILETNPITQTTNLIVLADRTDTAPGGGKERFDLLLAQAEQGMTVVEVLGDDGTYPPPTKHIARNSALVIRLSDLLNSNQTAESELPQTVKVLTGYPPVTNFDARMRFDPNHGGVTGGAFRSSRILIDMTVSVGEMTTLPINALGLPASSISTGQPNLSIRIPSRTNIGTGQFKVLTTTGGAAMSADPSLAGVVDLTTPTLDVVRALRSGNRNDLNNGFLVDRLPPEVVGGWAVTLSNAGDTPGGTPNVDVTVDLQFPATSPCLTKPDLPSVIQQGARFLEVAEVATDPVAGLVVRVKLRYVAGPSISDPANDLVGDATFLTPYDRFRDEMESIPSACYLGFTPEATTVPAQGVGTTSQMFVRFTEPIDPGSMRALDQFMIVRGLAADAKAILDVGDPLPATSILSGDIRSGAGLDTFVFTPVVPFAHQNLMSETFHLELRGPVDLAGNILFENLPFTDFTIDVNAADEDNAGFVLRFQRIDELNPGGPKFMRGQLFVDLDEGRLFPRAVARGTSYPVDRNNPVPAALIPVVGGVGDPLSPLGSKVMTLWRYADFGWTARDETKHNIDVIGLHWSPAGGLIQSDFFDRFEIALTHSNYMPDFDRVSSGLVDTPAEFPENVLVDPKNDRVIVHPRGLGYRINPNDLFVEPSGGTSFIPYPWNRGAQAETTYTWRDTGIVATGAPSGFGIPLSEENQAVGGPTPGSIAIPGQVPSYGLPLLMEFRCYPTSSGIGLNLLDASSGVNGGTPSFRIFSSGGVDPTGTTIVKNPDLQPRPTGGFAFNPFTGVVPTASADGLLYMGLMDTVIRISRSLTAWIDTGIVDPGYFDPVIEPPLSEQPTGTNILVEYRGAIGFVGAGNRPFQAGTIDEYGEIKGNGTVMFLNGVSTWTGVIGQITGARYVQLRFTFVNNIDTGLTAELTGLGFAYEIN